MGKFVNVLELKEYFQNSDTPNDLKLLSEYPDEKPQKYYFFNLQKPLLKKTISDLNYYSYQSFYNDNDGNRPNHECTA